jgi:hypothetical protein
MFQEDIVMDDYVRDVFNGEAQKRDAVSLEKYHWPTRTVHYVFDRDIGNMHVHQKTTARSSKLP